MESPLGACQGKDSANNTENQKDLLQISPAERKIRSKIREKMFTFEDLIRLDAGSVQTLLRNIDKSKLATALKGASEPLRELFFQNMSQRAGKILREEMEAMGPVRVKDVDEAQNTMVNLAKDLAAGGQIQISEGKGADELIY